MSDQKSTQTTPNESAAENNSAPSAQDQPAEIRPGDDGYVDPSLDRSTVQPGTPPPPAKQQALKYESLGDAERALNERGVEKPSLGDIYAEFVKADDAGAQDEATEQQEPEQPEQQDEPKAPAESVQQVSPEAKALMDKIDALVSMQQQAQQQSQQVVQTGDADPADVARKTLEHYMESVPLEYVQQIQNMENPAEAQRAISALLGAGLARVDMTLRGDFQQSIEQLKEELSKNIPQNMSQQQMQAARTQAMWNDLLGAHPDLNKPAIIDAMPGVIKRYMSEKQLDGKTAQYSQAVRDEIARKARAELGLPDPAETKAPAKQAPTQKRPPYSAPASNTRNYTPPDPEQALLERMSKTGP